MSASPLATYTWAVHTLSPFTLSPHLSLRPPNYRSADDFSSSKSTAKPKAKSTAKSTAKSKAKFYVVSSRGTKSQCPICLHYWMITPTTSLLRRHKLPSDKSVSCKGGGSAGVAGTEERAEVWDERTAEEKIGMQAVRGREKKGRRKRKRKRKVLDYSDEDSDADSDSDSEADSEADSDSDSDSDGQHEKLFTTQSLSLLSTLLSTTLRTFLKSQSSGSFSQIPTGGVYCIVDEILHLERGSSLVITIFGEEIPKAAIVLSFPTRFESESNSESDSEDVLPKIEKVSFSFALLRGPTIFTAPVLSTLQAALQTKFSNFLLVPTSRDIATVGLGWCRAAYDGNNVGSSSSSSSSSSSGSKPLLFVWEAPLNIRESGLDNISITIPGAEVGRLMRYLDSVKKNSKTDKNSNINSKNGDNLLSTIQTFARNEFAVDLKGCELVRAGTGIGVVGSDGRFVFKDRGVQGGQSEMRFLEEVDGVVQRRGGGK